MRYFVTLLILAGFGIAVARIACAPMNGAAQVAEQTLSGHNIINNYEWFFDAKGQFESKVKQVQTHQAILADETDKAEHNRIRMEMVGMQQSCRELAEQYNANSQKSNRNLFKSKGLPSQLSVSQCEGNNHE